MWILWKGRMAMNNLLTITAEILTVLLIFALGFFLLAL
jgi:hypothetical protein